MSLLYTTLKYILAVTLAAGISTLFAQGTQPISRNVVKGAVVNLAEVARYELQHPVKPQAINQLPVLRQKEATWGSGNLLKSGGSGVQRSSSGSVGMSPAPIANFTAQTYDNYAPANPFGAVSENYLVSTTQYMLVVQNRNGDSLSQVFIPNFWSAVLSIHNLQLMQQTKIDYDPITKRWIITSFCNPFTDSSSVLIGMSQTADPMGNWNLYKMPTDSSGATFTVFPMLGFNKKWVAVSGAVYYQNGEGFDTSSVFVFNKSELMSGAPTGVAVFKVPSYKTTVAVTYDSIIDNLYVLLPINAAIGQLMLTEITGSPGAEVFNVACYPTSGTPYAPQPPNNGENFAPQLGSPVKLQTGNNELTSLVYTNGNLWCAQTIFLPYPSDTRSAVQWWQFDTVGNILQLGQIDDTTGNIFYAYPSIAVNQYDDALIGYSVFSAQQYASGAYSYHDHSMPSGVTDSSYTFIAGLNSYVDTTGNYGENVWGGWSATIVDPINNTGFWTLQQYVPAAANTWQAQWANVYKYPTGISHVSNTPPSVQIFPNPNSGVFNMAINGVINSTVQIKIFNLLGEEVWNTTANEQGSNKIIPIAIPGLSKGLYIAEIYAGGFESVQKVVVE